MTVDAFVAPEQAFQQALNDVERSVGAFTAKSEAEATSKAEKLKALYDALEQAYAFHRTWFERPEYQAMLKEKRITITKSGRSSAFTPTIKALFDPALDRFETAGDADKRKEKVRRQKTVSAYCSSLELAQHQSRNDVANLLAEKSGIEEARKEWARLKPNPIASAKLSASEKAKYEAGLEALKEGMRQTLPDAPENAHRTFLAVMYIDENGKSHVLGEIEHSKTAARLIDNFIQGNAPAKNRPTIEQIIADLEGALLGNPSAANIKKVLGPYKAQWPKAVGTVVLQFGGEPEKPTLSADAQAMRSASSTARRMWGQYDHSGMLGYATAAERAAEKAFEYWELLSPNEKALFDCDPGDSRAVPVLRGSQFPNRAEINALAGEFCLEALRNLHQGTTEPDPVPRKMRAQEATERLKRLQSSIGKPVLPSSAD